MSPVDPDALCAALKTTKDAIASALRPELQSAYDRLAPADAEPFSIEPATVGRRRLRNTCLAYLAKGGNQADFDQALHQFRSARCMSESIGAAAVLAPHPGPQRDEALGAFYERAAKNKEELVVNKWFAIQASADTPNALSDVQALLKHPAYNDNPNRVRSVVSTFAGANPAAFHKADGSGYAFVAAQVIALDKKNPNLAARLASAFGQWRRYTPERSAQMKEALEKIKTTEGISKDTFEIASRSLA
jgi:aminopeptidase N